MAEEANLSELITSLRKTLGTIPISEVDHLVLAAAINYEASAKLERQLARIATALEHPLVAHLRNPRPWVT